MNRDPARDGSLRQVEACLAAIDALDPVLRAFITTMPEHALAGARRADAAAARGESLGVLHGMPVAIKDCIDVAGIRCTYGSSFFSERVPNEDAEVVRRLKSAGAVLVGKTNLHEFAYGGTTQNAFFGACRNPWDTTRIPGGSSGGSAVAVATGMCIGALGTETGASIRVPAGLNGVCGLRPTWGTIPKSGVLPVSPPHDVVGPMARSVEDVARLYAALTDAGAADRADLPHAVSRDLSGVRILVPRGFFSVDVDTEIATKVSEAAALLEEMGATLVECYIPGAESAQGALSSVLFGDAADFHRDRLAEAPEGFSDGVRSRLQPGLDMRAIDYARAVRWLEGWRVQVTALLTDVDAVLTPVTPIAAPLIADDRDLIQVTAAISRFSWPWSAAGIPALALPCGFSREGMPIGMQFAAAQGREPLLFQIGQAYQSVTDWHLRDPPVVSRAAE